MLEFSAFTYRFGFGRKGMEDIIKTEAGCLITFFEKHCDTQTFSTKVNYMVKKLRHSNTKLKFCFVL